MGTVAAVACGAVLLTATLQPAIAPAGAASAASRQSVPLVHGTLYGADAEPAPGARVSISAWPRQAGRVLTPIVIAEGTTDDDGRFSLAGPLPAASKVRGNAETVELEVHALTDPGHSVYYRVTVNRDPADRSRLAARTGGLASLEAGQGMRLQVGRGLLEPFSVLTAVNRAATGRSSVTLDGTAVETAPGAARFLANQASPRPQPVAMASAPPTPNCGASRGRWVYTKKDRKRFVPVQRITARRHATMQYVWKSTKRTDLAAGYVTGSTSYAGGLVGSLSEVDGTGQAWKIGNRRSKLLQSQWRYKQYRKKCYWGYTNDYLWYPSNFTGGSRPLKKSTSWPTWKCKAGTRTPYATRTWVVRTSRVLWKGWFQVAGIKLDARQSNTQTERYVVIPDRKERVPRLCGSNDDPIKAHRTQEMRR